MENISDSFTELMQYFNIQFNIYVILFLIVLFLCAKVTWRYHIAKKETASQNPGAYNAYGYDVIVTLLALVGMLHAFYFQGILADISSEQSQIWYGKVSAICILTFVAAMIQFVFSYKLSKLQN